MSIATQISRITGLRNRLRTKLGTLELLDDPKDASLQDCVEAVEGINGDCTFKYSYGDCSAPSTYTCNLIGAMGLIDYQDVLFSGFFGKTPNGQALQGNSLDEVVLSAKILKRDVAPSALGNLYNGDYLVIWNIFADSFQSPNLFSVIIEGSDFQTTRVQELQTGRWVYRYTLNIGNGNIYRVDPNYNIVSPDNITFLRPKFDTNASYSIYSVFHRSWKT